MADPHDKLEAVRKSLLSEPRINLAHHPIRFQLSDGDLVIEGEVADIAAKKLALERAAAVADVRGIIDRLRVAPAERMGDGAIRDLVPDALVEEPALATCSVTLQGQVTTGSEREVATCSVTLQGQVTTGSEREVAEFDAWYVFGVDEVVNHILVHP